MYRPFFNLLAATTAWLALAVQAPAQSASPDENGITPQAYVLADQFDTLNPQIANDILERTYRALGFVLYHEIAHLLINDLRLPVLGWEEDAADTLAVAMLLGNEDESTYRTLYAATRNWSLTAESGEELGPANFYDEHSLNAQRAYHAVCLMVGRNPVRYAEIADIVGMPVDQRTKCIFRSKRALDSWRSVLDPHRRTPGDQGGATIHFDYQPPGNPFQELFREVMIGNNFLQSGAKLVYDEFPLPREVSFIAKSCGSPGAAFFPANAEIVLCYELAQQMAEAFADDIFNNTSRD